MPFKRVSYSVDSGELTGSQRVRQGWFGRLVVQVEFFNDSYRPDDMWPTKDIPTKWRDAKVTDLHASPAVKLAFENK